MSNIKFLSPIIILYLYLLFYFSQYNKKIPPIFILARAGTSLISNIIKIEPYCFLDVILSIFDNVED